MSLLIFSPVSPVSSFVAVHGCRYTTWTRKARMDIYGGPILPHRTTVSSRTAPRKCFPTGKRSVGLSFRLDELEAIKICTGYSLHDRTIDTFPASIVKETKLVKIKSKENIIVFPHRTDKEKQP
ncbi:MAG: hypothetical protein R6U98_35280, partial [Pirellulaceae bacterium]